MLYRLLERINQVYQGPIFLWGTLLFVFVILGSIFLRGIYVGPDSLTYMRSTEVFFSANHSQASVQFPPLYSIILKALMVLGLSDIRAATVLNILIFSSSIWVCRYLFLCTDIISPKKALLLSTLLMSSYIIFITHLQMMTESLFILLVLINIALLERYTRNPNNSLLALASFIAALSALSRYAGVAVMLSTLLTLIIYAPEKRFKTWFNAGFLWGLSSVPFALWLLRNNVLYSTFTGREVASHERHFEGLSYYLDVFDQLYFPQMVPEQLRFWLFVVFAVLTVSMLLLVLLEEGLRDRVRVVKPVFTLSVVITIAFVMQAALMVVALYVDPFLPVQRRLLTPIYTLLMFQHFLLLAYYCRQSKRQTVFFVYAGLYLILNLSRLVSQEFKHDEYKLGYASNVYSESPLIAYMKSVKSEAVIASNGDDVMSWHLHRPIEALPKKINPRTNRANATFDEELKALYCQIRLTGGFLVFFNNIGWRDYLPSLDEITGQYEFEVLESLVDGIVLTPKRIGKSLCL